MNHEIYKKRIIPWMLGCACWNIAMIVIVQYLHKLGYGQAYLLALIVNVVVNIAFCINNSRILISRYSFLFTKTNRFIIALVVAIMIHVPLIAIVFLFISFQDLEPHSLNLRRLVLLIMMPMLILTPLQTGLTENLRTRRVIPTYIVNALSPSTESYLTSTFLKADEIFKFKNNINHHCPDSAIKHECILAKVKREHAISSLSVSEFILYVALDMVEIYKYKKRTFKDDYNLDSPIEILLTHNLYFLKALCTRATPTLIFGTTFTGLILGSLEITILDLVDEFIYLKFVHVAKKKLISLSQEESVNYKLREQVKVIEQGNVCKSLDF